MRWSVRVRGPGRAGAIRRPRRQAARADGPASRRLWRLRSAVRWSRNRRRPSSASAFRSAVVRADRHRRRPRRGGHRGMPDGVARALRLGVRRGGLPGVLPGVLPGGLPGALLHGSTTAHRPAFRRSSRRRSTPRPFTCRGAADRRAPDAAAPDRQAANPCPRDGGQQLLSYLRQAHRSPSRSQRRAQRRHCRSCSSAAS